MTFRLLAAVAFVAVSSTVASAADLRVGLIGLDTSHVIEFTKRFNDATDKNHISGAKVVAAFKGGSPDIKESANRIDEYTKKLQEKYNVKIVSTIEELCTEVDVVMLESVDGRPHLEQAKPVIKAKKTLFVDKPVAASLRDAVELYRLARENNVPIYSGSSLRFYPSLQNLKKAAFGELKAAVSTGPGALEPHHPDLFWYGIHATESLYTLMGPGCETVTCTVTPDTHTVTGVWKDGKTGTVRAARNATYGFQMNVFGSKANLNEQITGEYTPFLREVLTFLQTGVSPVSAEETLEIYAFMEAADESKRQGGCPVKIADVLKKAAVAQK